MSFKPPLEALSLLEDFLKRHFSTLTCDLSEETNQGYHQLLKSINYSLFSGGKRFRPSLGFLLGEALKINKSQLVPWLAAIECIHTYSLIHDDLPSMDNDSERRGQPTNHILFGEATALLAGDALLSEAFKIISQSYLNTPDIGLELVLILSHAAGAEGMVAGQAMDLSTIQSNAVSLQLAKTIHKLKTGALIQSVTEGVSVLGKVSEDERIKVSEFGSYLGLAFQIKDDLLDFNSESWDSKNIACHLGVSETKTLLEVTSRSAVDSLGFLADAKASLEDLIHYNIHRSH